MTAEPAIKLIIKVAEILASIFVSVKKDKNTSKGDAKK